MELFWKHNFKENLSGEEVENDTSTIYYYPR